VLDIQVREDGLSKTTKAVMELPGIFARARASALKSIGYQAKEDLQKAGRRLRPLLNPHTGIMSSIRDRSGKQREIGYKGRYKSSGTRWSSAGRSGGQVGSSRSGGLVKSRKSTRLEPFARFISMIRYKVDSQDLFVEIGLLNPKPAYYKWMRLNTAGFSTPITRRMRKMMFAIGFPVRAQTSVLRTPPRPWIGKVNEQWKRKAATVFENKFWAAVRRYRDGGAKA